MTLREQFVADFGEADACRIEEAAQSHRCGSPIFVEKGVGSDGFRWALLICVGSECLTRFREYHKIEVLWEQLEPWLTVRAEYFAAHDGDFDYVSMIAGVYNFLMPQKEATK